MFRAPDAAKLPHLETILGDLPTLPQVAQHLDVSTSTLNRYVRAGVAPRAVMLALYWETRWAFSAAETKAHNDATMQAQHAAALRHHNAKLKNHIARLELDRVQAGGMAANLPVYRVG
jgi:hypothetical protein